MLVTEARKLRISDDPVIANYVYVSPDMSPADVKISGSIGVP